MPNLVSVTFELIIAGIDRSSLMQSITLSQPDTSAQRYAPVSGKVDLFVPFDEEEDFTYTTSAAIAARWAQGAAVTYRIINESGTLVNHPLSGGKLFILKEPSPPKGGILSLAIGCQLAMQNQREADADVSEIVVGTSTPRKTVVERVLAAAKVTDYSIPDLGYPFNFPVPKVGSSFVEMAGKLVGADNHILHCNAAGTAIASPIDLTALPVTTLTVGVDDVDYEAIDGSNLPTVSELTISGTTQVPDAGTYPLLSVDNQYQDIFFVANSSQQRSLVGRITEEVVSEGYQVSLKEGSIIVDGVPSRLTAYSLGDKIISFDTQLRLKRKIERQYVRVVDSFNNPITPLCEVKRIVENYQYDDSLNVLASSVIAQYAGAIPLSGEAIILLPESRISTTYKKSGDVWVKNVTNEGAFNTIEQAYRGNVQRTITVNGQAITVAGFPDEIPNPDFKGGISISTSNNDDSTRPPATTYSRLKSTKELEVSSTVRVIPLAGIPSKEKLKPLVIDYLISNEQAYEYGKLEVILIAGRKQARLMITALTDALLPLRSRSRLDIIYRSRKFRCVVDAITYSQSFNERTIGFICDVINSSPLENLGEIVTPALVTNSTKITAKAQPATVAISANINFDIISARAEPAKVAIIGASEIVANITAQAKSATLISIGNFTP